MNTVVGILSVFSCLIAFVSAEDRRTERYKRYDEDEIVWERSTIENVVSDNGEVYGLVVQTTFHGEEMTLAFNVPRNFDTMDECFNNRYAQACTFSQEGDGQFQLVAQSYSPDGRFKLSWKGGHNAAIKPWKWRHDIPKSDYVNDADSVWLLRSSSCDQPTSENAFFTLWDELGGLNEENGNTTHCVSVTKHEDPQTLCNAGDEKVYYDYFHQGIHRDVSARPVCEECDTALASSQIVYDEEYYAGCRQRIGTTTLSFSSTAVHKKCTSVGERHPEYAEGWASEVQCETCTNNRAQLQKLTAHEIDQIGFEHPDGIYIKDQDKDVEFKTWDAIRDEHRNIRMAVGYTGSAGTDERCPFGLCDPSICDTGEYMDVTDEKACRCTPCVTEASFTIATDHGGYTSDSCPESAASSQSQMGSTSRFQNKMQGMSGRNPSMNPSMDLSSLHEKVEALSEKLDRGQMSNRIDELSDKLDRLMSPRGAINRLISIFG